MGHLENNRRSLRAFVAKVVFGLALGLLSGRAVWGAPATTRQQSLDEWRALTASSAEPPRVFIKGQKVQFYFSDTNGVEAFSATWDHGRIPTKGYKVRSAVLRWDQRLSRMPNPERGWREATVVAGAEWRRLATNCIAELTPREPKHAVYYQAFLADGALFRDAQGQPHFTPLRDQPKDVVIDRRFSMDETIDALTAIVDRQLAQDHPGRSLFLLMAQDPAHLTKLLLVDQSQRRCVWLSPAALYDSEEQGSGLSATAQGLCALFLESHGLALIKNPVSSAARLADLGLMTAIRFLRFPMPKTSAYVPPLSHSPGMNLKEWEEWLDTYTGTRNEAGSLDLLIDGDRFFSRLHQAIAQATNHIHLQTYIFDKDDVAVGIADQLKARSSEVEVKVLDDRLGSIAAGMSPPESPMPLNFTAPSSIGKYLREDSRVQVRHSLNPWLSADHSKVFLIDGTSAWVGGMNLGREYRYEWHDLMVEMHGPIVASFEDRFRLNWAHASLLGDLAFAVELVTGGVSAPAAESGQWVKIRRLPTRVGWKPFAAAVFGALRKSKSYVYAENPYLFDKRVIVGLVQARKRGVDVRVVFPRVNDFKAGGRGNLIIANYLIEHGVRVFFYPGMTHVKALLVDDWACLGSGNLNHLSLRVNQEQNIATSDPAFAGRVKRELFEEDFAHSYELTEPLSVDWVDLLTDVMLEGF